jgi:hypothetical protein
MTEALKPSELFGHQKPLPLTETVWRRTFRPFGKTPGSLTKIHQPDGLAYERT